MISEEVFELVKEMKPPISLYSFYGFLRRKGLLGKYSLKQIRDALKWLFECGKLKWVKEGWFTYETA